jgi:hypothetical protein
MKAKAATDSVSDVLAFALAGLARAIVTCAGVDESVCERLEHHRSAVDAMNKPLLASFEASLNHPREHDAPLLKLASEFSLTLLEVLCIRVIMAAEEDLHIGHAIACAQAPIASHRPTVGILMKAFGESFALAAGHVIGHGAAVQHGIMRLSAEDVPLAERQLSVPLAISLALQGTVIAWPGTRRLSVPVSLALGMSADQNLDALARHLYAANEPEVVVIRSGETLEARAAVAQLCETLDRPAWIIEGEPHDGLAAWLFIQGAIPVFQIQLMPGERRSAPQVAGFSGPVLIAAGPDGEFENDGRRIIDWRIPIPARAERVDLWRRFVGDSAAESLAREHRHSAARIATLGRDARFERDDDGELGLEDIQRAAQKAPNGLSALAETVPDAVPDEALVVPDLVKDELHAFIQRCRLRDGLVETFGPALKARYRPGVKALLVGPTGTGKTLAASWIATRLALPLFRVDLSAVTSKYIGDTEKNLSQLLSRAEESEVLLLFDEADSLFGKRTEVRDAHDRFANAQTNFLLQRLENYNGIVLLTSNSRTRFDSAFARRLDFIVEFPAPGAEERRALWLAHLGDANTLTAGDINRLAMSAELTGGQIRSALLCAAIHAASRGGALTMREVVAGLQAEYRKLGRQLPEHLRTTAVAGAA